MIENRKHPRQTLDATALIEFPYLWIRQVRCIVHDIGEGGAKLQTLNASGIPSEFVLFLHGKVHDCFVRWRQDRMLGVQFMPASMRAL